MYLGVDMALMNVIGSVHGMDEMYLGRVHVAMLFFGQFGDKPK
jgi:ferredoxin-fold anticodon binding domain-containing protein